MSIIPFDHVGVISGFYDAVSAVVVRPDGSLVVGGDFGCFDGQATGALAVLTSRGGLGALRVEPLEYESRTIDRRVVVVQQQHAARFGTYVGNR